MYFRHDQGIKHFNLARTATEFYVQDVKFSTIEALVEYYSKNDVPNQEGIKHVRLRRPILNQSSIMRQQSNGLGSTMSLCSDSMSTPPLNRNCSTLPKPSSFSREGSISSMSSMNSDLSKRNTASIPLPIHKGSGAACPQASPKHRKISFIDKLIHHKSKKRTSSDDNPTVPDQESSTRTRTQSESSIRIDERPPLPLPEIPVERRNGAGLNLTEMPQYDQVRDVSQDRTSDLIQTLQRAEQYSTSADTQCECGLGFEESELPRGWSMHISREKITYGRLFFMGPNKETAWNLPLNVSLELSADQQDRIRDLLSNVHTPQAQDVRQGGAVNESLQPASMPSSSFERQNSLSAMLQHQQISFEVGLQFIT